jgi:hypothetical protein
MDVNGTNKLCHPKSEAIFRTLVFTSFKKIQPDATVYQNFIISYLYEAQHVSGDTPPIIRSLKLHWHPLVFHTA